MQTIDQLTAVPTVDDIFAQMLAWLVAQGIPADQWRKGGVGRSILKAVATSFVGLATLISFIASMGFLDTATGDFLTLLAYYVYGVVRVVATRATGSVLASNASGSIYTYAVGEFIVQNTVTKKSFTNSASLTLNPGDTNIVVPVIATEQGTASNSFPGQVTTMGIADGGLSVTNILSIIGVDAWTDDVLRAACSARLGALSMMGPRGAYSYAIQTAKNAGAPVNVNRWVISPSTSTGIIAIRVAAPSGAADPADVIAIADNIEAVARPDCVTPDLGTVTTVPYAADLIVWAKLAPGVSVVGLMTKVSAALAAYSASYPIGGLRKPPAASGYLYDEAVRAVAQAADPSIFAVDSNGGTDMALAFGQVAAITSTIDVRLVTTGATT